MALTGGLIAESLRIGAVLEGVALTVTKISRAELGDVDAGQPRTWTFLDFEAPDLERFPALRLARAALEAGGARPAILNAANEVAVAAFLSGRLNFLEIAAIVADTLARYDPAAPDTLDAVLAIDTEARRIAGERVKDCVT